MTDVQRTAGSNRHCSRAAFPAHTSWRAAQRYQVQVIPVAGLTQRHCLGWRLSHAQNIPAPSVLHVFPVHTCSWTCSNVLLTEDLRACISDMGMARAVGSCARTVPGFTFTHAAPEQLLGQRWTQAADIYGLGVILIELTTQAAVKTRGQWRLPGVPNECSEVRRSRGGEWQPVLIV